MKIIKNMPVQHCMRGPGKCMKCKETYSEAYTLIEFTDETESAQPVVQYKRAWHTYNSLKFFKTEDEAKKYAKENNVPIILRKKYDITCKVCSSKFNLELDEDAFEANNTNYSCGKCSGLESS
ncbi:hypothetical protein HYT84_03520 [Candidatus Micrarchaeota archaeon]|nr:hypothetical protein [Candidatus Micrarchaeota archaeon]